MEETIHVNATRNGITFALPITFSEQDDMEQRIIQGVAFWTGRGFALTANQQYAARLRDHLDPPQQAAAPAYAPPQQQQASLRDRLDPPQQAAAPADDWSCQYHQKLSLRANAKYGGIECAFQSSTLPTWPNRPFTRTQGAVAGTTVYYCTQRSH